MRQVIQNPVAFRIPPCLVRQEVPDINTPVSPNHVVRDFVALQNLDQELTRDTQHPRSLDRGQLRIVLNDGDELSLMEVRDQVRQEIVQRAGQALGFAVTTYQPSTAALDFLIQFQYLLLISLGKGRGHRSLRRLVYAISDLSAISGARLSRSNPPTWC